MKVYAENYRGFKSIEIDLSKMTFLLGDNSAGKSSILYLIDAVSRDDLAEPPRLNEKFGVSKYDYFSPYFDNSDVTFGYRSDDDKDTFAKLVTVQARKLDSCEIVRCSYLVNDRLLTFVSSGSKLKWKITAGFKNKSWDEILNSHKQNSGYKLAKKIKGMSLGQPSVIFASFDHKKLGLEDFADAIFENVLPSMRLVSPIRALPEKFYTFSRTLDPQGLHFATMWMDYSELNKPGRFTDIEKFGKDSQLFDGINVRKISSRIKDSPLIVSIRKSNKEFLLNQVGVGVSQVVPVLIETVFARNAGKNTGILVQQPELHLHPIAQAALGSYFYSEAKKGLRGVLETHSSYFLDRFRADLRDDNSKKANKGAKKEPPKLLADDVSIIFCRNGPDGNIADSIKVGNDGKLIDEPKEYHEFFVDELVRTMF